MLALVSCQSPNSDQRAHDLFCVPSNLYEWNSNAFKIKYKEGVVYFHAEKYAEALEAFTEADNISLFEVPNFASLPMIANAACELGQREYCLLNRKRFDSIVRIYEGSLSCDNYEGFPPEGAEVFDLARMRVCSEVLDFNQSSKAHAKVLREFEESCRMEDLN